MDYPKLMIFKIQECHVLCPSIIPHIVVLDLLRTKLIQDDQYLS